MQITRYGHSCLLVEDGDARLLLDPGTFSSGFEDLRGLTAVLVTHAHPDHLDVARLGPLLEANPDARLHVDEGSVASLEGLPHVVVHEGDRLDLGATVAVVGSRHAVIHPDLPVVPNVGYLVAERFFTPGDALTVPEADVDVLGVPVAAPWLRLGEAVDYLRAVAPRRAFPVHDAVTRTLPIWYAQLGALGPDATSFSAVPPDAVVGPG